MEKDRERDRESMIVRKKIETESKGERVYVSVGDMDREKATIRFTILGVAAGPRTDEGICSLHVFSSTLLKFCPAAAFPKYLRKYECVCVDENKYKCDKNIVKIANIRKSFPLRSRV